MQYGAGRKKRGADSFVAALRQGPVNAMPGRGVHHGSMFNRKGQYIMTQRHHGVLVNEVVNLTRSTAKVAVGVGVVCTADDADESIFPLNTPVLISRASNYLDYAGTTGTLWRTLKSISEQCEPQLVVVRVAEAEDEEEQERLVIGGTDEEGSYTGLYSLLAADTSPRCGIAPRILAAPGLDTAGVAGVLGVIARKLRGFAYVSAWGCKTVAEAIAYRDQFSARELMVIWPDWIVTGDGDTEFVTVPATAYAVGMRASIDASQGWHKSLSNVAVSGVVGISRDVSWNLLDSDTDADELNRADITTLIKYNGFRFWGNRTCDTNGEFVFEVYTRTAQLLSMMVAEAHMAYIDKPLTPSLVKDVVDSINAQGQALVTDGQLLGFECWYDSNDNSTETLREGRAHIRYKYTPVPPLECLELTQEFTDEYFAVFSSAGEEA